MQKTLGQAEIDALFEAARASSPEAAHTEIKARVVPYNFSSAGQISTDQLRAISMLNDLFARNLTHNLTAWLRTRFRPGHSDARVSFPLRTTAYYGGNKRLLCSFSKPW